MRIKIEDGALFFDIEGSKLRADGPRMREVPTLILLHGGPGFDHSTFKPAMSPLTEVAQIVYLDHRGQGRSERAGEERLRLNSWADDVMRFCEALEIVRPVVMGHSFGGFVAAAYAARYPDHPAKLILSSTTARIRLDRAYRVFERLGGREARDVAQRFWEDPGEHTAAGYIKVCFPLYNRTKSLADGDAMRRTIFNRELMYNFIRGEGRHFNLLPELSRIRCPTLLLAGEDDPICPIEDAEDIAQRVPADLLRFERFPNAGHGVFRDAPERALQVIREFIEN